MITRSDIRQETNTATYSRGQQVWQDGKVHDLNVEEKQTKSGETVTEITALVEGSHGEYYDVAVTVDEQGSEILSDTCTCPAYQKYWGMCKHCVAVMLAYIEWRKERRVEKERQIAMEQRDLANALEDLLMELGVRRGTGNLTAAPSGKKTKKKVQKTSPGLSKLMANYAMRDKAVYLPGAKNGQVRLEAKLQYYLKGLQVEFRIGINRMYVLKSISQFASAVLNLEQVTYGANLSFLHCMEAFTPECRPMVRYLIEQSREKKFLYQTPYGQWYSYETDRYLNLESWMIDSFMDALEQVAFTLEYLSGREYSGRLENGLPPLEIALTDAKKAIQLTISPFDFYEGRDYTYFFDQGTIYREKTEDLSGILVFLRYLRERSGNTCTIGEEDYPVFCQNILPILKQLFYVKETSLQLEEYLPPEATFSIYLDLPEKTTITCGLYAVYGEKKFNVFKDINNIWQMAKGREVKKEMAVYSRLIPYFSAYDQRREEMVVQGEEQIYELLTHGIEEMREVGEVFVSDALKSIHVLSAPRVSAGVSLEGNLLEMDLSSNDFTNEELAAILSRYDRKKKYYRMKNGDFVNMDEEGIRVLAGVKDQLKLTEAQLKSGKVFLPKYRALYVDQCFREQETILFEKNREFRALIRNMKTIEENDFELPGGLQAKLRPYQSLGFRWLKTLCRNGFGGILADDMGLGKTLQVITFLLSELSEAGPEEEKLALIVAPASLVYNWKSEIERFAPDLSVCMITGNGAERKERIHSLKGKAIAVTSYDLLKRDVEEYGELHFFCEVIDEAQFIKNHTTQGARAVKKIQADFHIALTGTPVENRLSELWSIFDYLMPGFLYGYQQFREQIESPIVREQDQEALKKLQTMIRPFVLRRLKKDVLKDLPDKIEKNMFAELEGEQSELYRARAQRLAMQLSHQSEDEFKDSRFQVLAEITRLRQICCDPALLYEEYHAPAAKVELCIELLKNALEGGHRVLLFSQFTSMLDLLAERMQKEKISCCMLTGSTSKEERARLVERFQNSEIPVFCISLKAGGTGLNLTAADLVIHFDPWWNAAVENQATDRAHRIGQKQVVTVYRLIAKNTIEEKILKLQEAKKELARQVLSGDELKSASFTREELLGLLEYV